MVGNMASLFLTFCIVKYLADLLWNVLYFYLVDIALHVRNVGENHYLHLFVEGYYKSWVKSNHIISLCTCWHSDFKDLVELLEMSCYFKYFSVLLLLFMVWSTFMRTDTLCSAAEVLVQKIQNAMKLVVLLTAAYMLVAAFWM